MKIKYVRLNPALPKILAINKGEWIDLRVSNTANYQKGELHFLPLGIRLQLPKEFEAWIVPRSSTFKNYKLLQANSVGIVDSSYCGPTDEWKMPVLAMEDGYINMLDRVCQFRIIPSQKASMWTKLKWLFTNSIEFVEEEYLTDSIKDRGGFGSTGRN